MEKKNINLDIIRSIAVFCVLSVHFFMGYGFYEETIVGVKMYFATTVRTSFAICVPLFMLLTGFLMNKKTICKKYYFGLLKVLIPYVLSVSCIGIYRALKGDAYTLPSLVLDVAEFGYYSWYVEMYIGLYLMIPFLNIIYNNIELKKQKQLLLVTGILISIAPTFFNAFDKLLYPDWWQGFFPVTYYFMGAYIAEYKEEIRIGMKKNFILIVLSIALTGGFCYFRSYNSVFNWGDWCTAGGFANLFNAPLIFIFLLRISTIKLPRCIVSVIYSVAKVSLPLYLVSYIFDSLWYPILNAKVVLEQRMFYYPLSIAVTFISSFILAVLVDKVSTIIYGFLNKKLERYL